MAYDNIEIEIKIKVDESSFETARKQLNQIAVYKGKSNQIDTYYSSKEEGYLGKEEFPYKWLSIRERSGKIILNYKNYYPEGAEKHQYCDEYETEVGSVEAMNSILNCLGVERIAVVDKVREKFVFKDEFEIVLDSVKDLGCFIEIEALKDLGGIEVTRQKVEEFISNLDISSYKIDYRGYPFLIFEL